LSNEKTHVVDSRQPGLPITFRPPVLLVNCQSQNLVIIEIEGGQVHDPILVNQNLPYNITHKEAGIQGEGYSQQVEGEPRDGDF
jgi:hypothetical protein